jgi:hypothetical protein
VASGGGPGTSGATNYGGVFYAVNGTTVTLGINVELSGGLAPYYMSGFTTGGALQTSGPGVGSVAAYEQWYLTISGTNQTVSGTATALFLDATYPTAHNSLVSWSWSIIFNAAGHP